jgi:hypothetical protein
MDAVYTELEAGSRIEEFNAPPEISGRAFVADPVFIGRA